MNNVDMLSNPSAMIDALLLRVFLTSDHISGKNLKLVVDLRSGQSVASFEFAEGVEEIFDVKIVPGVRCLALRGPHVSEDQQSPIWIVPPLS